MCNLCDTCPKTFAKCYEECNDLWNRSDLKYVVHDTQVVQCNEYLNRKDLYTFKIYKGTQYQRPTVIYITSVNTKCNWFNAIEINSNEHYMCCYDKDIVDYDPETLEQMIDEWELIKLRKDVKYLEDKLENN